MRTRREGARRIGVPCHDIPEAGRARMGRFAGDARRGVGRVERDMEDVARGDDRAVERIEPGGLLAARIMRPSALDAMTFWPAAAAR